MRTLTITIPSLVDSAQLRQELTAAGFTFTTIERDGNTATLSYEEKYDPEQITAIVDAHRPAERDQLDQLVAKARAVWNETDTFTVAQVQKILAGLVLLENRRR